MNLDADVSTVVLNQPDVPRQPPVRAALGFSAGAAPPTIEDAKSDGLSSFVSAGAAAPLHRRVWGLLGAGAPVAVASLGEHQVKGKNSILHKAAVPQVQMASQKEKEHVSEVVTSTDAQEALASVRAMEASFRQALNTSSQGPKELDHLKTELQRFSDRLEALEKNLSSQSSMARENALISAVKGFAQEIMRSELQDSNGARISNPKVSADASRSKSKLRTFDFESWRRQQSAGLQQERERVLLPAERIAVIPLSHK
jgi:hypothetical protein